AIMTSMAPLAGRMQRSEAASTPPGYDTPYAHTVTLSLGWPALTGNTGLPAGSTQQNNAIVRYVEKKLNVHFKWAFLASGDAYTQKVALTLASGTMPDMMAVNFEQLHQLATAGQIQDLTQVYQQYALPYIKELYSSNHNRALQSATINGKIMAIPDT